MARSKPSARDLKDRKNRAHMWKEFRRTFLFTQKRLGDIVHISRRTVQQIEAAKVTPNPDTLRRFLIIKKKFEREADV